MKTESNRNRVQGSAKKIISFAFRFCCSIVAISLFALSLNVAREDVCYEINDSAPTIGSIGLCQRRKQCV